MTRVMVGHQLQINLDTSSTTLIHHVDTRQVNKKMGNVLIPTRKNENSRDLVGMLKTLNSECRNCAPITPLQCINRCQVYKLKNELRKLRETMDTPNYIKELFNVLKMRPDCIFCKQLQMANTLLANCNKN